MFTWNYRIVEFDELGESYFGVCEVHTDNDGTVSFTEPMFGSETIDGVFKVLDMIRSDITRNNVLVAPKEESGGQVIT